MEAESKYNSDAYYKPDGNEPELNEGQSEYKLDHEHRSPQIRLPETSHTVNTIQTVNVSQIVNASKSVNKNEHITYI